MAVDKVNTGGAGSYWLLYKLVREALWLKRSIKRGV